MHSSHAASLVLRASRTSWPELLQHRVTCSCLSPEGGGKDRKLTAKRSVSRFAILGGPDGIFRCISSCSRGWSGYVRMRFYLYRDSSAVIWGKY